MKMKLNRITSLIFLSVLSLLIISCAPKDGKKLLADTEQNVKTYTKIPQRHVLISTARQTKYKKEYLQHYFYPWTNKTFDRKSIWKNEYDEFTFFFKNPGYGENKQVFPVEQLENIRENMKLTQDLLPSFKRAITTNDANVRRLPTDKPSFENFNQPGKGYPFDSIQSSYMAAYSPIIVFQISKDKQWALVQNHFILGWIKTRNIAYVDDTFIKHWRTKKYVTPTERRFSLQNDQQQYKTKARVGSIYPVSVEDKTNWTILIAARNQQNNAIIEKIKAPKSIFKQWPMKPIASNFKMMINNLLGEPYGWGGMYGYRDCSSTLQDLFASFGVWLPRSSSDQADAGRFIDLKGKTAGEKLARLKKSGKPLMTLVDINGHIMLYLGSKYQTAYVFQNMWGVHYRRIARSDGRIVIGKAVITPIDMGEEYLDIKGRTALDKVHGITIIASGKV